MNCNELYRRIELAKIVPISPLRQGEFEEEVKKLTPVAIYLGDDEYRLIMNDRELCSYTNAIGRKAGEPLMFMGIPLHCIRAKTHCFIATEVGYDT